MFWRIHVDEGWFVLCRFFSSCRHLRESGSPTLLGQPVIREHFSDVLVLDNQPWVTVIPQRDARYWVRLSQSSIFNRRLDRTRAAEWEFWWTCS